MQNTNADLRCARAERWEADALASLMEGDDLSAQMWLKAAYEERWHHLQELSAKLKAEQA